MKKAEQIPRGGWRASAGAKRLLKKLVRKARRQAERFDVENVPLRFTRGWYW